MEGFEDTGSTPVASTNFFIVNFQDTWTEIGLESMTGVGSMDNDVLPGNITTIPEPSTWALLIAAVLLTAPALRSVRRNH